MIFFSKQKTAYELRISDWSSDVCSSDLVDAMPSRGEAARRSMLFEKVDLEPAFAGVNRRAEAGDPAADDYDPLIFRGHGFPIRRRFRSWQLRPRVRHVHVRGNAYSFAR